MTPNRSVTVVPDRPFLGRDVEPPIARATASRLTFEGKARRTDDRDADELLASTLNLNPYADSSTTLEPLVTCFARNTVL